MHKIFRVVIDTNHIMSAILSARGASAKLIEWMTREEDFFRLLISQSIWDEYRTVADWLIPQERQEEKARILRVLLAQSELITPESRLRSVLIPLITAFWNVLWLVVQITLSQRTSAIFHPRNMQE